MDENKILQAIEAMRISLEARLDASETRMDASDRRMEDLRVSLETRLDASDRRMDVLEETIRAIRAGQIEQTDILRGLAEANNVNRAKMDSMEFDQAKVEGRQAKAEASINEIQTILIKNADNIEPLKKAL